MRIKPKIGIKIVDIAIKKAIVSSKREKNGLSMPPVNTESIPLNDTVES